MPCCKGDAYGAKHWCKNAPLVDWKDEYEDEYCIFHAPAEHKGISDREFNALVMQRIKEAQDNEESINLSHTIFPSEINFSTKTFTKAVDFRWVVFTAATSFRWVKFAEDVDFSFATFTWVVDFNGVTFMKTVDFSSSNFKEDTSFSDGTFTNIADFRYVTFIEKVYFSDATFTEAADFRNAVFTEIADFRGITFADAADFRYVTFIETVDFRGTTFKEGTFYEDTFKGVARLDHVQIDASLKFHNVNLKGAAFRHTDLGKCKFITCKWNDEGSRYRLYDETSIYLEWMTLLDNESEFQSYVKDTEDLYCQMKLKARDDQNMYAYSLWHHSEKEMMWLRTRFFKDFFKNPFKNPFKKIVLGMYRLFSGFGEEPLKALATLAVFIIMTGLMLGWHGIVPSDAIDKEGMITLINAAGAHDLKEIAVTTLEHISFTKSPKYVPYSHGARFWLVFFKLLIPIQAALFGVALRNRFRR